MNRYFLKRLLKLDGYFFKIFLLLSLIFYFLYTLWPAYDKSISQFERNYVRQYEVAKTLIEVVKQPTSYKRNVSEQERDKRALDLLQGTVNFYEAIINEDFNSFPEKYLKVNNILQERYKNGEEFLVPNPKYRTQAEFQQLNTLEQVYYQKMVNSSIDLDSKNVLKVSAFDALLLLTGYWWAQGYKYDNLSYIFLLVPILFSGGLLSRDKRRGNFYLAIRYSNQSYLKDLFNTLFVHHTILQLLLLVVFLLPLGVKFGISNLMATAQIVWGEETILVSLGMWLTIYFGIIVLLTVLLTLLSLIGELLFRQIGSYIIPVFTILISLFVPNSNHYLAFNPFAYLDISRSINGYGKVLYGIWFSIDRFLIGWCILFIILVCISKVLLFLKSIRCEYV